MYLDVFAAAAATATSNAVAVAVVVVFDYYSGGDDGDAAMPIAFFCNKDKYYRIRYVKINMNFSN